SSYYKSSFAFFAPLRGKLFVAKYQSHYFPPRRKERKEGKATNQSKTRSANREGASASISVLKSSFAFFAPLRGKLFVAKYQSHYFPPRRKERKEGKATNQSKTRSANREGASASISVLKSSFAFFAPWRGKLFVAKYRSHYFPPRRQERKEGKATNQSMTRSANREGASASISVLKSSFAFFAPLRGKLLSRNTEAIISRQGAKNAKKERQLTNQRLVLQTEKALQHQYLSFVLSFVIDQMMKNPAQTEFVSFALSFKGEDFIHPVIVKGGEECPRLVTNLLDFIETELSRVTSLRNTLGFL